MSEKRKLNQMAMAIGLKPKNKQKEGGAMQRFEGVEDAIIALKFYVKGWMLGTAIATIAGFFLYHFTYIHNRPSEFSTFEACYYGIKNIIENAPSEEFVNESIIKDLKESKIKFNAELVGMVKVTGRSTCDVFIKELRGTRRYLVTLERGDNLDHKLRVLDVKEKKVKKEYQIL